MPGSAQIRVEAGGEVWVVSGDYKPGPDPLSTPFEPVRCHHFVSECTFGLPVFDWPDPEDVARDINDWWAGNVAEGRFSLLGAYALGKAQRVLAMLDPGIGPILTHGAVEATNAVLRTQGLALPETEHVTPETDLKQRRGALVIAPPGALGGRVGAAVPPRLDRLCQRLDAPARRAAQARGGSRLRHVGSRRLGGPQRRHRRNRGRDDACHPRLYGGVRPLARLAGL